MKSTLVKKALSNYSSLNFQQANAYTLLIKKLSRLMKKKQRILINFCF